MRDFYRETIMSELKYKPVDYLLNLIDSLLDSSLTTDSLESRFLEMFEDNTNLMTLYDKYVTSK